MKVLLTGGAGFMGSSVARRLVADGHEVTVLDVLTYAGSRGYLEGVPVAFTQGDVCDAPTVAQLTRRVDMVVHMAAETHVERSLRDAEPFVRTNIEGTRVMLEMCRHASIPMVHVSTDEVFGAAPPDVSFREDDAHAPGNPYAVTKAAAESLVRVWSRCYGYSARIVRCVNNYGDRQHTEKAVAGWVERAVRGEPLMVHGAGAAVRDWLHVEDFAAAMGRIVTYSGPRQVFHLAAQCHRNNLEMAQQIAALAGGVEVVHVEDRPGQDARYALDDAGTREDLGWKPAISLEDGLRGLVEQARRR